MAVLLLIVLCCLGVAISISRESSLVAASLLTVLTVGIVIVWFLPGGRRLILPHQERIGGMLLAVLCWGMLVGFPWGWEACRRRRGRWRA